MKHAPNKAATNMTKMFITSLHDDTMKKYRTQNSDTELD